MSEARFAPRWTSDGFCLDRRFAASHARPDEPCDAPAPPPAPLEERLEEARRQGFDEGHARGFEEANALAETAARAEREAQTAIAHSFARIDARMADDLRDRLRATVLALCEQAVLPLALDADGLAARVECAVRLFADDFEQTRLVLHPDDLDRLRGRLPQGLAVCPSPVMEPGSLRLESDRGGLEDGPAQWRSALNEALGPC